MAKVKIDKHLYERIKQYAADEGYSSVDEFINHVLEKELEKTGDAPVDDAVTDRLKGLGYLE